MATTALSWMPIHTQLPYLICITNKRPRLLLIFNTDYPPCGQLTTNLRAIMHSARVMITDHVVDVSPTGHRLNKYVIPGFIDVVFGSVCH
jgi:hypothetical protein